MIAVYLVVFFSIFTAVRITQFVIDNKWTFNRVIGTISAITMFVILEFLHKVPIISGSFKLVFGGYDV